MARSVDAGPAPTLFDLPDAGPQGLRYREAVLSVEEGDALLPRLAALPFQPFAFHGYQGLRGVVSFGHRYDFAGGRLLDADPIPDFLEPARARAAEFAGVRADEFRHVLVTEYRPGAPIGWHRDRPEFDKVVGLSLGSRSVLRFRRRTGKGWARFNQPLEVRSAYLLDGPARWEWQHSIGPAPSLRYSITLRTLRG